MKKILVIAGLWLTLTLLLLQLGGCGTRFTADGAPRSNIDTNKIPDAVPKAEPFSKYGNPRYYYVNGKKQYVLKTYKGYNKVGFASWYGTKFHGRLTSTREPYSLYAMTAASRDLPIPCYVRVTNLENGRSVIVRVNDRGPFVGNRILDLSYVAAKKLGYANRGTTLVRVTAIDPHDYSPSIPAPAPATYLAHQFYLQVGAFGDRAHAENYRQRVAGLISAPVYVKVDQRHNVPVFKVQVGPLAAHESEVVREKLESQGLAVVHVVNLRG